MAGWFRRLRRIVVAVAPWALASLVVTVLLDRPLAAEVRPIRTFVPIAPTQQAPKPRAVTFEPWELVPS